jgi:DNA-binding transcriptional ArsR family regulator
LEDSVLEEIKEQVIQLTREINRLRVAINENRTEDFEDVIVSNHLKLYAEHEDELLPQTLERCLNAECTNNNRCQSTFREYLSSIFRSIETETLQITFNSILEELEKVSEKLEKAQDTNCFECYSKLEKELLLQWRNLEKISGKKGGRSPAYDIEKLVNHVFKPLSHPIRLMILVELNKSSLGFSDLSEKTGTRGGHLLFHLDQLIETGLVVQNRKKGDYNISYRGRDVLSSLGNLS